MSVAIHILDWCSIGARGTEAENNVCSLDVPSPSNRLNPPGIMQFGIVSQGRRQSSSDDEARDFN
jgi:hypothetical protein